jgi:hypothetical protein
MSARSKTSDFLIQRGLEDSFSYCAKCYYAHSVEGKKGRRGDIPFVNVSTVSFTDDFLFVVPGQRSLRNKLCAFYKDSEIVTTCSDLAF